MKSPISSVLSDTETGIVQTITFRMTTVESLQYLKQNGIDIGRSTFFRVKKRLEQNRFQRLVNIANRFTDRHLQRLDKLELIEQLMWKHHAAEKSALNKVRILESIVNMQPCLSAYYDAIRWVMEGRLKTDVIQKPVTYLGSDSEVGRNMKLTQEI